MDRPLYDSIALTKEQYTAHTEEGWEYTVPVLGVIYGRKHLSGPLTSAFVTQPDGSERQVWFPKE